MVVQIIVGPCPANQPNLPWGAQNATSQAASDRQPSWTYLNVTAPIFGER